MLVDHFPEAREARIVRDAFEHQSLGAVGHRAVDDVAVAGDPTHVGGAPVNLTVLVVEDVLMGDRGIDHVAAGGVQNTLRLAGRTRGVEDEQRIFRALLFGLALGRNLGGFFAPPQIAAGFPLDVAAGALEHQDVTDAGAGLQGLVDIGLQRHLAAAAQPLVGGNDEIGLAVEDAVLDAVGREAAEDHRMDGADPGAGQQSVGGFGHHRHVDGDAVALLDALVAHDVGQPADLFIGLAIGDLLAFLGVVAFPNDRGLVAAGGEVAVETVDRSVEGAIVVPANLDVAGEINVLHLGVGLDPIDALALLTPKGFGILDRLLVHRQILGVVDPGALGELGGNREKRIVGRHGTESLPN